MVRATALRLASIPLVAAATYLVILDNFFISDDFVMLSFLKILEREPLRILEVSSEIFRMTSYLYFMFCYKVFGLNSAAYYALGILLHAFISLVVYVLVTRIVGDRRAGWTAALFFAAYERHQEAIMWISAANDTILTLSCLLCLLCWERYLSGVRDRGLGIRDQGSGRIRRGIYYVSTLVALIVALFSKETAVVLLPSMMLMQALRQGSGIGGRGSGVRDRLFDGRSLVRYVPFAFVTAVYLALWFSKRQTNFFLVLGFYSFGLHFFPVYARSLARLLVQALLFLAPLLYFHRRKITGGIRSLLKDPGLLFFAALLVMSIAPYCFLTYLDHIPSRNTYLPSAGLAGVIGILVVRLYDFTPGGSLQRVFVALFFTAVLLANAAYIWVQKEPQYRERAAPTRALVAALNQLPDEGGEARIIYIKDFPLQEIVGKATVEVFSRFPVSHVVFVSRLPDRPEEGWILRWNETRSSFEIVK